MRDDKPMDTADLDVLADVAYELFGDAVDPREIVSKANDASEMHVPSGRLTLKEKQKRKRQAQVGYASNILGLGAGTAAVVAAARNPALKSKVTDRFHGSQKMPEGGPITSKLGRYVKSPSGRARLYKWGAIGALGTQVANTAGDVVGNVVLSREAKKKLPTDRQYDKVKKALDDITDARRRGVINTDTAIAMAEELVTKAVNPAEREAKKIVPVIARKIVKPAAAAKPAVKPVKVDKPDQSKPLFDAEAVGKSDEPDITWTGTISKMDTDKRQVFGYATVTHLNGEPVVDLQGDYVPLDEIEKAAYTYVIESRKGGDMHRRDGDSPLHTSDLVESFVVTPEKLEKMGLPSDAIPHGWWVGFKVNDDSQWEMVKKNERTGFSIHGSGRRVEKEI